MGNIWTYIADFHFIRPLWLIALVLLIPLMYIAKRHVSTGGSWNKVCDAHLLEHLIVQGAGNSSVWAARALLAAFVLSVLAMAGPTCKKLEQVSYKGGTNTVFVLDVGLDMTPQDVSPSRLERAKFAIYDILEKAKGDQAALILFDDEAYVVTPLSEDFGVIRNILPTVDIEVMPGNGTSDVAKGINEAIKLLDAAAMGEGRIIVITGANDNSAAKAVSAAKNAATKGHIVSVVAVGSEGGAPAPKENGGFYTDSLGKTVIFKTGLNTLQKVAQAGNGGFVGTNNGSVGSMEKVMISPLEIIAKNMKKSTQQADEWFDLGVYLLILVLPLTIFAFKKGFIAVLFMMIFIPSLAQAGTWWDSLWFNKSQQAVREMKRNNYKEAEKLFESNAYKGYASYRAQDYPAAVRYLSQEQDETSFYNLGNALAYSGDINGAINAYKEAIEINPANQDAIFNRDYLQQQQQNQNSKDDKQSGDGENGNDSKEQSQNTSPNDNEGDNESEKEDDTSEGEDKEQDNPDKDKDEKDNEAEDKDDKPQWMNQIDEDKYRLLRARLNKMYGIKQGK